MCILDADHPFIAPGPNDMRGREFLPLENVNNTGLLIIFLSMPRHEHACEPWLHL
jgi:hypothetical protein